ncbi:putative proteasome subunit alpha type-4 [Cucumispora dikerogammari]|nr:putative proteasome subunit alpha type-4 [Cucumispora dikerogammari]
MVNKSQIFNIFSKDGTIEQLQYALTAARKCNPFVIWSTENEIIICTKKPKENVLECFEDNFQLVNKCTNNIFFTLTGIEADCAYLRININNLAVKLYNKYSYNFDAKIFTTEFAQRNQQITQETRERISAFLGFFYGFDQNNIPIVYFTDSSGICYNVNAYAIGLTSNASNKFLDGVYKRNLSLDQSLEYAIEALTKSIKRDFFPKDLEVAVITSGNKIKYLTEKQINTLVSKIEERGDLK